jgi:hypothetical protein
VHAWSARRALPRTFQGQRCAWSPSCCSRITMAHCERNTPRASGYQCNAFLLGWLLAPRPRVGRVAHLMNFVVVEETLLSNRRLKKFSFRRKTVKRKEAGAPEREGLVATIDHRTRSDSKTPGVGTREPGHTRDSRTHGSHRRTSQPSRPTNGNAHARPRSRRTPEPTEPHGRLPSEPAALCTVTAVDRIEATPDGLFSPQPKL